MVGFLQYLILPYYIDNNIIIDSERDLQLPPGSRVFRPLSRLRGPGHKARWQGGEVHGKPAA